MTDISAAMEAGDFHKVAKMLDALIADQSDKLRDLLKVRIGLSSLVPSTGKAVAQMECLYSDLERLKADLGQGND